MNVQLQIIVLGVVQGITEFLPISSSGHLVILQSVFQLKEMLFYDVLLHFATLLAVIVLFFKDIIEYLKNFKLVCYIILLTIPTGIIGLVVKKYFSFVFENLLLSGIFLSITGLWLFVAEKISSNNQLQKADIKSLNWWKAILVGISQGIAVLPGISRSGATLGNMLMLNFEREEAVKFVFIASIPAILGATIVELKDIVTTELQFHVSYIYGMILAFIFGLLSLKFLIKVVSKQKLKYFSYYCWFVSLISIMLYFILTHLHIYAFTHPHI